MSIYTNDEKLTDGEYSEELGEWRFNLKDIPHDGYDVWLYETYAVKVDSSQDNSGIASFELDTSNIKKKYNTGEALDLFELNIKAITKNGNHKNLMGIEACKVAGFNFSPDNRYVFTEADKGTKQIDVSFDIDGNTVTKSFNVEVIDTKKHTPKKVEIFDSENTLVKSVDIDADEFESKQGHLIIRDLEIPAKYRNWDSSTFTVKVTNADGEILDSTTGKRGIIFKVYLPDYEVVGSTGYIWFTFKLSL